MMEALRFYPEAVKFVPLATIRRERRLPVPGKVLVQRGDAVEAATVLAMAEQPAGVVIVDIARALKVAPERAAAYLRRKPGAPVRAREILARRRVWLGLRTLEARSPVEGEIVAAGGGKVLIRAGVRPLELRAGFPGTVVEILPSYGAVIETTGALIQAFWSSGADFSGMIRIVTSGAEPLRARAIDPVAQGTLVVGGAWIEPSALEQAERLQVRGIIAGSMEASLLPMLRELSFPVVLIEGFGRLPMHPGIFRILSLYQGREAFVLRPPAGLDGRPGRPEILIPVPTESPPPPEPAGEVPLQPGMRVRLLREPYRGRTGTVSGISAHPWTLDSGLRSWCAEIHLDGEEVRIRVPVYNVEILRS
ncbi:hypothetical protein [Thermoflexus sp.]|uniref:hypothetical protein n=2 Tax=Thermoflexus sp. TaxID=1969742 RepID=UPI0025ECF3EE|nr:hypothetical protein [Thermoflexus sp.]MCS6963922.1 hypothetical protein [Thermoflexus sp.]MCX7690329.1 hypothetical protein [Thermoflexus sp.]MDW8184445.1 hypothetical protein [Anaerolineae bacterium]